MATRALHVLGWNRAGLSRSWSHGEIFPPLVFLILSLAVLGPLLRPGYILTVDSPLALNWDVTGYFWGVSDGSQSVLAATYNSAPIAFLLKILAVFVPDSVVQKLWIMLLFWLAALGASRLPYLSTRGSYYAGIFYAVNPFTYVRFVSGQWGLLGAYALMPFAVTSFIHLLERPHPRAALKMVLVLTLIGFLQVHGLVLVFLVLAGIYTARVAMVPGTFRNSLRMIVLTAGLFLGINFFWIVRYILAGGAIVENMSVGEMSYFGAMPATDVLTLRGFWLSYAFLDISDVVPMWRMVFLPLFLLAAYGAISMIGTQQHRWLSVGLVVTGAMGMLLAAGPTFPVTMSLFSELWEHVPSYRAFRDSQKFVMLLALVYAYLGAYGLSYLLDHLKRDATWVRKTLRYGAGFLVVIPIIYALPIFGAWGQLSPTEFPEDWTQVRETLDRDSGDYSTLVLPWHMYMTFEWLPNRWQLLANPASNFFSTPTISGDNLEIPPSFSNSPNQMSRYVEWLLEDAQSHTEFGKQISPLNAKYVVLFKSSDYEDYTFLDQQEDLARIFEGETISLYRNLSLTARAYTPNDLVSVESLKDYRDGGYGAEPLERVHVFGSDVQPSSGEVLGKSVDLEAIDRAQITRRSPVSYHVDASPGTPLILTLPQQTVKESWRYVGEPSVMNLGMMPAFSSVSETGIVSFSRFYNIYLPTYLLAIVSVMIAVFVYTRRPEPPG